MDLVAARGRRPQCGATETPARRLAFNLHGDDAGTVVRGSDDDILRLGASLERTAPDFTVEIGVWLQKLKWQAALT